MRRAIGELSLAERSAIRAIQRQRLGLPGIRFQPTVLEAHGRFVPDPLGPDFGANLPARIAESSGSTFFISTTGNDTTGDGSQSLPWLTPSKALSTVALGSRIFARGGVYNLTGDHTWNRVGTAGTVTTLESFTDELADFSGGRFNINGGKYLRLRNFIKRDSQLAVEDNIKIQAGAQFIDIDKLVIKDSHRQGFLVQGDTTSDWQIWNTKFVTNGTTDNLDHGMYVAASASGLIANCVFDRNQAYGIQLYPNADNIIVVTTTFDGHTGFGASQASSLGAITISGEATKTENSFIMGCLMTNGSKAVNQFWGSGVPVDPNKNDVQDCIGGGNSTATEFDTQLGVVYARITQDTNPLYVNQGAQDFHLDDGSPAIDYIDAVNYDWIPPTDIEGTVRVTADAGAYAYAG